MLLLDDHWTWDFWTAKDGDDYHLFFLKAPKSLGNPDARHQNARVGHAVSTDLTNWTVLPDAIGPGARGEWDDMSTWTGSVIRAEDRWHMYYTGVNHAEQGLTQRIGRAFSDDLVTWTKDSAFRLEADPRWYEQLDLDVWFDLTWRDPWVYFDDAAGEYRMLITARAKDGAVDSRGVIGFARSTDLVEWEVLPPIASPGAFGHLEVPQLEREGDRWYLFFSAYEWAHGAERVAAGTAHCGTHYLVADNPAGPFRLTEPQFFSGDPVGELYAGRVARDPAGRLVFLAFLQFVAGGPFVGGLSDPFPVVVDDLGKLHIERGPEWSQATLAVLAGHGAVG